MAIYRMRISPATTIKQIVAKVEAFKSLYECTPSITATGRAIATANGDTIFATNGVRVSRIGKKYLFLIADGVEDRVNMGNPDHGIWQLEFRKGS